MISEFINYIYNYLSFIEKKINWNLVLKIYKPIIIIFIISKITIFILAFFIEIPRYIIEISQTLSNIIYIAIALYCIMKFGPWSHSKFIKKDSEIIFRAGILLLSSSILGELIESKSKILQYKVNKSINK